MEPQAYNASCHCGAVRCEIMMAPPQKAFSCNCSICSRGGWLLGFAPLSAFRLVTGENNLTDYQFAKKRIHHVFCKTCGVRPFSRGVGPDGTEMIAVNLRCIEGFDAAKLPVETFDGASL